MRTLDYFQITNTEQTRDQKRTPIETGKLMIHQEKRGRKEKRN